MLASRNAVFTVAAAMLAAIIGLTTLCAVIELFQRDGRPMDRLVAAERACAKHIYVSEREACVREWLAAAARDKANRQVTTAAQNQRAAK